MHKIRNYPFKLFPKNSFLPGEGMKYDSEVILEALHNAILCKCLHNSDYVKFHIMSSSATNNKKCYCESKRCA